MNHWAYSLTTGQALKTSNNNFTSRYLPSQCSYRSGRIEILKLHNDIILIYESRTDTHANNVTYLGSRIHTHTSCI